MNWIRIDTRRAASTLALALMLVGIAIPRGAVAEVTADQRQALRQIKADLGKVGTHLRARELDEASQLLDACEEQLQTILNESGVPDTDRQLLGVPQLLNTQRKALEIQRSRAGVGGGGSSGVSFAKDVSPILVENCLGCHGADNPRAGLSLATFSGMKRGGRSGRLLTPGSAQSSLLMARLTSPDANRRMPRGSDPLSREQLGTIATWINQGARYDAQTDTIPLDRLSRTQMEVVIPKPKGTETVSFSRDIAPFVVRLCVRCHSGGNPSSGLSLVTFEDMMIGGDSGAVILPGQRTESRLFRLVGGLENPRMPQGQARITRQNYEDLIKWFDEGNVFDGEDPRAPLASYVSTDAEIAAARFEAMSADEFLAHRREQAEDVWKRSLPNDAHETIEREQFLIVGDVDENRLNQIADLADEQLAKLRRMFDADDKLLWKGKLAIIVFGERFGFSEYVVTFLNQQVPEGMYGHAVVTPSHSDAYIVLQDLGDEASSTSPGMKANLIDQLSGAFIERGGQVPDWMRRGLGLALAAQSEPANPYFKGLTTQAVRALESLNRPGDVLRDGTFSPADVGPVGYVAVEFLLSESGTQRLMQLMGRVQAGNPLEEAVRGVFGTDVDRLGQAILTWLRRTVAR